ncbi:hypothetical protein ABL840_38665 [Variovorax sp. NFACC27]|uniref:DUF6950 family protein n=1 Tax=unclassified Variovorax TaxID=663243 RepID=UPI0008992A50|nr:hypothetical protein SAMN03159371_01145 [Variovorax sp. NFACC28]SEF98588.1 hypothetical protein SAMN03159365_01096 [Variovorax sp. NFACC29]SFB93983.1 hypothetical protein SAMN03159379_01095 [Variovorax sp. NFACC26]SFF81508.1 hypothetical protein SAMN03159447_00328 [Variovorax sp. NFACC27]
MTKNLDDFIAARRSAPFEYFRHDCVHIAADWIIARTGKDPLADLREADAPVGRKNLLAAMRAVRAAGGFMSAASERLGPALPGAMAQRGDVVLARSGGKVGRVSGYSFGICTGSHIAAPATDRLVFLPLTAGVATWRV